MVNLKNRICYYPKLTTSETFLHSFLEKLGVNKEYDESHTQSISVNVSGVHSLDSFTLDKDDVLETALEFTKVTILKYDVEIMAHVEENDGNGSGTQSVLYPIFQTDSVKKIFLIKHIPVKQEMHNILVYDIQSEGPVGI